MGVAGSTSSGLVPVMLFASSSPMSRQERCFPKLIWRGWEEVHHALLNRFWGSNALQMKGVVLAEAESLMREYRDVIYDAPFQFQADMLFAVRAVAILSGIATSLDETFDPWQEIIPFAERLASKELPLNWQEFFGEVVTLGQICRKLPKRVNAVITQAERGNLTLKSSFTADSRKVLVRLENSVNRLSWTIASAGLLIAGSILRDNDEGRWLSIALYVLALLAFLAGGCGEIDSGSNSYAIPV